MTFLLLLLIAAGVGVGGIPGVYAWGAAGHEMYVYCIFSFFFLSPLSFLT